MQTGNRARKVLFNLYCRRVIQHNLHMSFITPSLGLGPRFRGIFGVTSFALLSLRHQEFVYECQLVPFHAIRITPHSLIGLFNLKSKAIKAIKALSQSEIRVHWRTHNSKKPTSGRRDLNSTPHQTPRCLVAKTKA